MLTVAQIASVCETRWKSAAIGRCVIGSRCTSRSSTESCLPSTSRLDDVARARRSRSASPSVRASIAIGVALPWP